MLLSLNGEVLYQQFRPDAKAPGPSPKWRRFIEALDSVDESDLVFANGRLYVRRTPGGYLLVLAGSFVQSAMIRLHCDILLPELAKLSDKKWKRFFKR